MGAWCRKVGTITWRRSSCTSASHSRSTRSTLVSATQPRCTPSSWQMSRCSRVWGMTPSSAATTSITMSMPPAPATMLLMKRSCPGTSTTPNTTSCSRMWAKPSSMVIPRRRSSLSRSVSMPVSALTSAVLP